jgi:hypothetical protein
MLIDKNLVPQAASAASSGHRFVSERSPDNINRAQVALNPGYGVHRFNAGNRSIVPVRILVKIPRNKKFGSSYAASSFILMINMGLA